MSTSGTSTSGLLGFVRGVGSAIGNLYVGALNVAGSVVTLGRVNNVGTAVGNFTTDVVNSSLNVVKAGADFVSNTVIPGVSNVANEVAEEAEKITPSSFMDFVKNLLSDPAGGIVNIAYGLANFVENNLKMKDFGQTLRAVADTVQSALIYQDGVTESRYGQVMERSWVGSSNSFLNLLDGRNVNLQNYTISFSKNTPLDPLTDSSSLYGNMILGTPMVFTKITDPRNRTMLNTFVKDSNFLSLTPGLPKYNGGAFMQQSRTLTAGALAATSNALGSVNLNTNTTSNVTNAAAAVGNVGAAIGAGVADIAGSFLEGASGNYLNQTNDPEAALAYLLKNGIDAGFTQTDKRYYTFEAKYAEYFSYLETMLNTVWLKLGLGTEDNSADPGKQRFNIFTFFDIGNDNSYKTLDQKYNSSIGFYVNIASKVTESLSSSQTSVGAELGSGAEEAAGTYQKLNYLTGMGTDKIKRQTRAAAVIGKSLEIFKSEIADRVNLSSLRGIASTVNYFTNENDMSALVQAFSTNGMRVKYPELWSSTDYGKNIQFDFNFVSPYGDPLSIFQYVYVPFMALLTFAMPRQAAENGIVSPFFIRADVPGLVTSDLAMLTEISWIKGGENNLWTKDKLPRAISGSFTITDLYPYLAMVKRLSFLSANPSYTVFLDNMAGLRSLYTTNSSGDSLNKYWNRLLKRVTGETIAGSELLWNSFSNDKKKANTNFGATGRESISKNINKNAMSWLSKV
jgi:hypothetical protein